MYEEDFRIAIESHIAQNWALSAFSTVPVYFTNPPVSSPSPPYIKFRTLWTKTNPMVIGSNESPKYWRIDGELQFDVYTLIDKGSSTASKMLDVLIPMFARKNAEYGSSGRVVFGRTSRTTLGVEDGKWREALRVLFHRDVLG